MGNTTNAAIGLIFAKLLIHWCVDGMSHKNNLFTRLWSNATHLLGAEEITNEVALCISKPAEEITNEVALCISKPAEEITNKVALCISKPAEEITNEVALCIPKPKPVKVIPKDLAWVNLPPELCGEIGKRLGSRITILRFRSVCKLWRSSLPSPTRFPLRVPPLPNCDLECQNLSYLITEINVYKVGDSNDLVMELEEVDEGDKFRARFLNSPRLCQSLGFLLNGLRGVSKAFHFRTALHRSFEQLLEGKGRWDFLEDDLTRKTVIISQNLQCLDHIYSRLSDLIVVAHMSSGKMRGRLALLRLRGSPNNWVWETDFCTTLFQDITTYKGQLCMLDLCGKVFLMDSSSFSITQVCDTSSIGHNLVQKQLFEAYGNLYVTGSSTGGFKSADDFEAYKFSFGLKKWVKAYYMSINGRSCVLLPFFSWKKMTQIVLD